MIPNGAACGLGNRIQPRPGGSIAGIINIGQCSTPSTDNEGVYTCTMMSSAMMNQSVRFGILYFSSRSESFNI